MTAEALLLLNRLLQLAQVDDAPNSEERPRFEGVQHLGGRVSTLDWTSKRCLYIQNLRCVQAFRSQVLDP